MYRVLRRRGQSARCTDVVKQELEVPKRPCQVGPGKGYKLQFSTDMGLDWRCIDVFAGLNRPSRQNLFSFSFLFTNTSSILLQIVNNSCLQVRNKPRERCTVCIYSWTVRMGVNNNIQGVAVWPLVTSYLGPTV